MMMFEGSGLDDVMEFVEDYWEEFVEGGTGASTNVAATLKKLKKSGRWFYAVESSGCCDDCAIFLEEFCDGVEVIKIPACA